MSKKIIAEIERIAAEQAKDKPEWVRQLRMAEMGWDALEALNKQAEKREA